jgi:hypothetical protein
LLIKGASEAQSAVIYGLTQRGFYSEINVLICHYAYALAAGEAFFVDDEGFVTRWARLFASPVPLKAELNPSSYAAVIDCNPKRSREAWIERLRWVVRACRLQRRTVAGALGPPVPVDLPTLARDCGKRGFDGEGSWAG